MEATGEGKCSVVYYCDGLEESICELYQDQSPPRLATEAAHGGVALDTIYHNIRMLLDENQGGCHEGNR